MTAVLLSNAYNARNAGDGLLVELSMDLVRDALRSPDVTVCALAPESFPSYETVAAPATSGARIFRMAEAACGALGMPISRLNESVLAADRVLAVGGGYLRFRTAKEAAKTRIAHLSQLETIRRSGVPYLMLPQSIGPLRTLHRGLIPILAEASRVYVRDDRTFGELEGLANISRVPDLAVLEASTRDRPTPTSDEGRIGVIVRPLPQFREFEPRSKRLAALLGKDGFGLLQSAAGGGNQDEQFSSSVGFPPENTLAGALQQSRPPSVTISVRMHGSLQSILSGVPSIHLSYERKGFSAFSDLGLDNWVHPASTFDPVLVAAQARELANDAAPYWRAVDIARTELVRVREQFMSEVRDFLR